MVLSKECAWFDLEMIGEIKMDVKELFIRAAKSGCLCSIFYHGFMLITGAAVTLKQVVVFTMVFILLYFLWLVLVSAGKGGKR